MQEGCWGTDNDFPKIQIKRKLTMINITYSPFPITHPSAAILKWLPDAYILTGVL